MVEEGQAPTPHGETAGAGLDTKSENIEIIKSGAVWVQWEERQINLTIVFGCVGR